MKSYARLYPLLFERLHSAAPFGSRKEAEKWLRDAWVQIHIETGASSRRIRIMKSARICEEQGWHDVDKNVCFLQSPDYPPLRLFVHNDGAIVLQRIFTDKNEIIFAKPAKKKVSSHA